MKVLKFSASWCGPCKSLSEIIEKAGDKITVPVEEIDIDSNMNKVEEYGIRSVPTLILLDNAGIEMKRNAGTLSEKDLLQFLTV